MKNTLISALIVSATLALTACSEKEDAAYFNETMKMKIDHFKARWIQGNAAARGVTKAIVKNDWRNGGKKTTLDSSKAASGFWYNYSTDFCSAGGPDTGLTFDFKAACARHDFGWRNLKHLDDRWSCAGSRGHADVNKAKWCGVTVAGDRGLPKGTRGRWFNKTNRDWASEIFYNDMKADCNKRNFFAKSKCMSRAVTYKGFVDIASAKFF